MLNLETNRLRLRSFQDSDVPHFSAYRSDPLVAKYQSWDTPFTRTQASQFIDEMKAVVPGTPGEWYQIAIELKNDQILIGDCAFHILADDHRQAEIGFTLARSFQGQGFAFEAVTRLFDYLFEELHLHRIQAICDVDNLASSRLLERLGLRREAHFIENIWFKGEWRSEYVYGLLQKEWENRSNGERPSLYNHDAS